MEKIKRFYNGLSGKRKIIFWVCIAVFVISIIKISVWHATKGITTNPRHYLKNLYSEDPKERKFAIYEVGRREILKSIPILEKILIEDTSLDIKRAAAWSIGKIDKEKLISMLDKTEKETKDIVMEALLKLDRNNIYLLLKRFSSEDDETKLKILTFAEKSKEKGVYEELLKIGEMKEESLNVRKPALQIVAKNLPFADIESILWNLYYNDPNKEIKEFSYALIKELKEKRKQ